jgi:hypothetical protein
MPHFRVVHSEEPRQIVEFDDIDARQALEVVRHNSFKVVDVFEDKRYLFTIWHPRNGNNLWTIFQRDDHEVID